MPTNIIRVGHVIQAPTKPDSQSFAGEGTPTKGITLRALSCQVGHLSFGGMTIRTLTFTVPVPRGRVRHGQRPASHRTAENTRSSTERQFIHANMFYSPFSARAPVARSAIDRCSRRVGCQLATQANPNANQRASICTGNPSTGSNERRRARKALMHRSRDANRTSGWRYRR